MGSRSSNPTVLLFVLTAVVYIAVLMHVAFVCVTMFKLRYTDRKSSRTVPDGHQARRHMMDLSASGPYVCSSS